MAPACAGGARAPVIQSHGSPAAHQSLGWTRSRASVGTAASAPMQLSSRRADSSWAFSRNRLVANCSRSPSRPSRPSGGDATSAPGLPGFRSRPLAVRDARTEERLGPAHCRPPSRTEPLLLTREKLLDVLAAELGTFHDGMADAREHFLEPGATLTLADLLGAPLDPLGRLVHLGLVGGAGRPAGESQSRKESGSDPYPAKSPCHHVPPSVRLAHRSRDHQLGPVARCDPMPATSSFHIHAMGTESRVQSPRVSHEP